MPGKLSSFVFGLYFLRNSATKQISFNRKCKGNVLKRAVEIQCMVGSLQLPENLSENLAFLLLKRRKFTAQLLT